MTVMESSAAMTSHAFSWPPAFCFPGLVGLPNPGRVSARTNPPPMPAAAFRKSRRVTSGFRIVA